MFASLLLVAFVTVPLLLLLVDLFRGQGARRSAPSQHGAVQR